MTDKKESRRAQIETAAFEVLAKVGYKKASMLQIAKQAKASNETLYAWYGNKQALFSSLIESNARHVRDALHDAVETSDDPEAALTSIAQLLLRFTATERAIIVNRAAVADVQDSGLLAKAIEQTARQVTVHLLDQLLGRLDATGTYRFGGDTQAATGVFISLLLGELQMQQALGSVPPLTEADIEHRATQTLTHFATLYKTPGAP